MKLCLLLLHNMSLHSPLLHSDSISSPLASPTSPLENTQDNFILILAVHKVTLPFGLQARFFHMMLWHPETSWLFISSVKPFGFMFVE